jgi:acetyl-CoA C-acetyltransferase/acetyl-CoA acyltransferase 2
LSKRLQVSNVTAKYIKKNKKRNYASNEKKVFLVNGKRTPFTKFGEKLKEMKPTDLAVHAVKATLAAANVSPKLIDHLIFANVLPSTTDTLYGARHTLLKSGGEIATPAYTVNRLCGSGIQAISDARTLIQTGQAECVVAVGVENMSLAPHLVYGARFGTRFGPLKTFDMLFDSLTDSYCGLAMAITAEQLADKFNVTRQESDQFAYDSHMKAINAYKQGFMQEELAPVTLKKGNADKDDHIRVDCKLEDLKALSPSFQEDGRVTPGNASGIVDGAAAVLICSEDFVKQHGLTPFASVHESVAVGVPPNIMGIGPVDAINKLLKITGLRMSDIDLFEINEAFAAQAVSCIKALDLNPDKLNIWGGAVAIGHPLGASGVRITNTLARQLKKKNKSTGIASACIGGGQGIAILIRSC